MSRAPYGRGIPMIEPYQWLLERHKELGLQLQNIGPASVDLCLGEVKLIRGAYRSGVVQQMPIERYADDGKPVQVYTFYAHKFYLCSTVEYVRVPVTHCAFVQMRSSWARRGLGHKMAGFVDPGFHGQITLELEPSLYVEVPVGERLVQLVYCRLSEPTDRPYVGKYLGQQGATEAYAARDTFPF